MIMLAVHDVELILVSLLVAVAGLATAARLANIPFPIVLVVGGLVLGFVPGPPDIQLAPELVLVIFLPPLLYSAAFFANLHELRTHARGISMLAIGLVLATMCAVAAIAHAVVDGLPWAAAFALGAIVAPTDPLAATAIARRLAVPRRLVSVIEGESLVNDGTALVAYRVAAAAATGGAFSLWNAGLKFVLGAAGGVLVGIVVGWIIAELRRRLDDVPVEITISLLSGYAGYLPAERLGASGVLAAVTVGIVVGWRAPQISSASMRLQGYAAWETLVFLLNALLFVLIGLQLPLILDALSGASPGDAARAGRGREPRGDPHTHRVEHHDALRRPSARPPARAARAAHGLAQSHDRRVVGHARRGLARRRARPPSRLPAARHRPVLDVRGDLHDARPAGAHAPRPHPPPGGP
jgi:CPA1 family monovalent cation:H+ antiporter